MIKRPADLSNLRKWRDKDVIKVVTGVRRCGKSTLLEMFRQELLSSGVEDKQTQTINFEDPKNSALTNWRDVYDLIPSNLVPDVMNYIFLDEVQTLDDFEKLANGLQIIKNVDLYMTGSNAYFLSSELATLLSGRYVEIKLLPLSFRDYIAVFPNQAELNLPSMLNNYMTYGAFPQSVELQQENFPLDVFRVYEYLEGIYNTVIFKDVALRTNTKNIASLESVAKFMMDNIGNMTSAKRIADTLTSSGRSITSPTVENFLTALTESFILYPVSRYDVKGKQLLQTQEKYYLVDLGLRSMIFGFRTEADYGRQLENVIYLELLRRGYKVYVGKAGKGEVDFIAQDGEGYTSYYQVSASIRQEDTKQRELEPLLSIGDYNHRYLITLDPEEFDYSGIRIIQALDKSTPSSFYLGINKI